MKKNNVDAILESYNEKSPFGHLQIDNNSLVTKFIEKPLLEKPINIGFYFFNIKALKKIATSNNYELEDKILSIYIKKKNLIAYNHRGFHFTVNSNKDLANIKKIYKKNKNIFNFRIINNLK